MSHVFKRLRAARTQPTARASREDSHLFQVECWTLVIALPGFLCTTRGIGLDLTSSTRRGMNATGEETATQFSAAGKDDGRQMTKSKTKQHRKPGRGNSMSTASKKPPKETTARIAPSKPAHKRKTKADQILALMKRPEGATLTSIMKVTRWQAHSVRGFISGHLVKKMKLRVASFRREGERVYAIRSSDQAGNRHARNSLN